VETAAAKPSGPHSCLVGRRCHRGRLIAIANEHQRCVQECTRHQSTSDIGRENSRTSSAQFWSDGSQSGREFQAVGPATENARRANLARRCRGRGTMSWWRPGKRWKCYRQIKHF